MCLPRGIASVDSMQILAGTVPAACIGVGGWFAEVERATLDDELTHTYKSLQFIRAFAPEQQHILAPCVNLGFRFPVCSCSPCSMALRKLPRFSMPRCTVSRARMAMARRRRA